MPLTDADRKILGQRYPDSMWNLRETEKCWGKRIRLPQGQLRFIAHPGGFQAHQANKQVCGFRRDNPKWTCSDCRRQQPVVWEKCWQYPQPGSDDPDEARRNRR